MNFDVWGNRRNASNWTYSNVPTHYMFDRGYTLHEHLNDFKLINMIGRVYDPVVARFLSPDPFIQSPDNSQGLNRYSYAWNNPLIHIDPSGYNNETFGKIFFTVIITALATAITMGPGIFVAVPLTTSILYATIGGVVGGALMSLMINNNPRDAIASGIRSGIASGLTASFSFAIGSATSLIKKPFERAMVQAVAHGTSNGIINIFQGAKFEHGFYAGFLSSISGSLTTNTNLAVQTITGAVVGGTVSKISGGKFANGAVTGAFVVLFNHAMHEINQDDPPHFIELNETDKAKLESKIQEMIETSREFYTENKDGKYPDEVLDTQELFAREGEWDHCKKVKGISLKFGDETVIVTLEYIPGDRNIRSLGYTIFDKQFKGCFTNGYVCRLDDINGNTRGHLLFKNKSDWLKGRKYNDPNNN